MVRARLLLADRNAGIVEALGKLLEPEFEVIATVTNGLALLEKAAQLRPDVVILDLDLPRLSGMAAGRELRNMLPRTKTIILTASEDLRHVSQSLWHWASAYLLKESTVSELITAIHDVLRGTCYVTPSLEERLSEYLLDHSEAYHAPSMTIREQQILQLLAEGHTMKEIAAALSITPRSVAFHKYEIMRLHSLRSNSDIVMFAIMQHMAQLPA